MLCCHYSRTLDRLHRKYSYIMVSVSLGFTMVNRWPISAQQFVPTLFMHILPLVLVQAASICYLKSQFLLSVFPTHFPPFSSRPANNISCHLRDTHHVSTVSCYFVWFSRRIHALRLFSKYAPEASSDEVLNRDAVHDISSGYFHRSSFLISSTVSEPSLLFW